MSFEVKPTSKFLFIQKMKQKKSLNKISKLCANQLSKVEKSAQLYQCIPNRQHTTACTGEMKKKLLKSPALLPAPLAATCLVYCDLHHAKKLLAFPLSSTWRGLFSLVTIIRVSRTKHFVPKS